MQVEITILKKKESMTYPTRGVMHSLFIVNKIDSSLLKEFSMSFEMTHMLKKKNFAM